MTLTPVQQTAYDSVHSRLQEGFFGDVNEADLNSVKSTLQNLSAKDADAVVDAMAKSGDLQRLADESDDSEFLGAGQDGFSASERRDLFADLAKKLDGDSLGKVHDAFAKAEKGNTEISRLSELASAIASHGSTQAKLDYIDAIADGAGTGSIDSAGIGGSSSRSVDGEAVAIGTVLSSLRGANAEKAIESLSDAQLGAVLKSGIDETVNFTGSSVTSSFDPKLYNSIMSATATVRDPEVQARVFAAGAEPLRTVRDADDFPAISLNDGDLKSMSGSLAKLLDSNTTGIMKELTYDSATRNGSAMATYSQVMIETKQTDRLAEQMVDLQFGNNHNQNAVNRLDAVTTLSNGQQRRENAGALGYFVGSVYAGAQAHSGDVKKQQEVVSGFLNFVAGKIPIGGGLSATDATLGQDLIKQAVEAAIKDPGLDPAQRIEAAALPIGKDGELAVGDPIFSAFEDTLSTVQRLAKP